MSVAPIQPEWFRKKLEDVGGKSFNGSPRLRVVWAEDQRDHLGRYKYIKPDGGVFEAWVLERYQEAGFFGTPEEWAEGRNFYDDITQKWIDVRGPYPSAGAYTMVMPLCSSEGNYVALTERVCTAILQKVRNDMAWASLTHEQREAYLVAEEAEKQRVQAEEQAKKDEERDEYYKQNWGKINRGMTRAWSTTPA